MSQRQSETRYELFRRLLVPAIALHNFEEWLTFHSSGDRVSEIADSLGVSTAPPPEPVIETSLLLVTVTSIAIVAIGSVGRPSGVKNGAICFIASAYLANVFLPHLAIATIYATYTPGLITALLINLPLCGMVLISAKQSALLSIRALWVIFFSAALALPFLVLTSFTVSSHLLGL